MKKRIAAVALVAITAGAASADLIITGIVDGPLSGGTPKAIELYVTQDVADLSIYSVGNYSNGAVDPSTTFPLSGSAAAGTYLYVASNATGLEEFFADTISTDFVTSALLINGDDAMGLTKNDMLHDVYGVIGQDGTGQGWEYTDSWAYRLDGTGPSATFDLADWTVAPVNSLDGLGVGGGVSVVPFGTFVPTPGAGAMLALGSLIATRRRRR